MPTIQQNPPPAVVPFARLEAFNPPRASSVVPSVAQPDSRTTQYIAPHAPSQSPTLGGPSNPIAVDIDLERALGDLIAVRLLSLGCLLTKESV